MFYCKKQICTQIISTMVPVFYGHTQSQQIVRPWSCIFSPSSNSHFVNTELTGKFWLNAVVSPDKREEKTRLVITKQRAQHLFSKPQVFLIIGQLFRRKQKGQSRQFIPLSSKDHQDFYVTAWSPLSLQSKVSRLQTAQFTELEQL